MLSVKYYFLPEDKFEEQMAENGKKYWLVLNDFSSYLRSKIKWGDDLSEDQYAVYEEVQGKLYEIMDDLNVNLDEME